MSPSLREDLQFKAHVFMEMRKGKMFYLRFNHVKRPQEVVPQIRTDCNSLKIDWRKVASGQHSGPSF